MSYTAKVLLPTMAACAVVLWGCDLISPTETTPRHSPSCTDPVISTVVGDNDPQYRVIFPNGGQTLRVGMPCTLRVTSLLEGRAQVSFLIGEEKFDVPGLDRSLNTPNDSSFIFVIPGKMVKSFFDPELNAVRDSTYSTVSDSCRIRVVDYYEREYQDVSDCLFSITDR